MSLCLQVPRSSNDIHNRIESLDAFLLSKATSKSYPTSNVSDLASMSKTIIDELLRRVDAQSVIDKKAQDDLAAQIQKEFDALIFIVAKSTDSTKQAIVLQYLEKKHRAVGETIARRQRIVTLSSPMLLLTPHEKIRLALVELKSRNKMTLNDIQTIATWIQ
jgi:hypothetical protein